MFERMNFHDLPIWIHPARTAKFPDYVTEEKSEYEIWWTLGWPYETSVAMSRLVFGGYFDDYPNLKIITHHMGGMIPYFEGRVGPGWDQLGARTSDEDLSVILKKLKKPHLEYFKGFYADTASSGPFPARNAVSIFSARTMSSLHRTDPLILRGDPDISGRPSR